MSALGNLDASFTGTTTIVTGGAGGMGRAISLAFSAAGSNIVVADMNDANGNEVVEMVKAQGGNAVYVRTNVALADDVEAMVKTAVDTYGGLNFAVNAAAIEFEVDFLADLADGCDVSDAAAECGNGFTDGFNGSSGNFLNRSSNLA